MSSELRTPVGSTTYVVIIFLSLLLMVIGESWADESFILRLADTETPPTVSDSLYFSIAGLDSVGTEMGLLTLTSIAENPATEAAEIPRLARMYIATYADTAKVDSIIARYEACSEIEYVERDTVQLVPYTDYYPNQWTLNNTGQIDPNYATVDIDAPEAWSLIGGGSSSIKVAVLDQEFWTGHPDLVGQVAGSLNATFPEIGTTDFSVNSHGTPIAGVIAGKNDGAGIKGVAYGTRLLTYSVLYCGSTLAALEAAHLAGARVISSSVGSTLSPQCILAAR